jgi:formylglycine-generating enzyme required for sulfatase activity
MHGNVTEWCWDWFAAYSAAKQTDPQGASHGDRGRVARGGSWNEAGTDQRSAIRFYGDSNYRLPDLGFRLARSAF